MKRPGHWSSTAYNPASESENKIHADDVARRFGFRGGLVPGVTVYAYLAHPAIEAWGRAWLERGSGEVVLEKPLYDGEGFEVKPILEAGDASGALAYKGCIISAAGTRCAKGSIRLPDRPAEPPRPRGDRPVLPHDKRPAANRVELEKLADAGMGALSLRWQPGADDRYNSEMSRYTRDPQEMPELLRPDGAGLANVSFTLGMANWVLAANVRLGPWIHVQSEVTNHAAVPPNSELLVESRVLDLFTRGGHEFVDLEVAAFIVPDTPVVSARHRAIYRLRE